MKEEVDVPNSPLGLCERPTTLEKRKKIGGCTENDCMQTSLSGLGRRFFFIPDQKMITCSWEERSLYNCVPSFRPSFLPSFLPSFFDAELTPGRYWRGPRFGKGQDTPNANTLSPPELFLHYDGQR